MPKIDNYWNRYDESKHYTELLMRDGYGTQASEINEIQSIFKAKVAKLANSLFGDGDVVADGQIVVDASTGDVKANSGQVFAAGEIWDVPPATFQIPTSGYVAIGIQLTEEIISELEDPGLRNPAIGHTLENEPGAWRRKITAKWTFGTDSNKDSFFPVYDVQDGMQAAKEAPPNLDSFNQTIARYDRDSTGDGSYLCNGLRVTAESVTNLEKQYYNIEAGRARVNGNGIELPASWRIGYATTPDLRAIDTEVIVAKGGSSERVNVAHPPVWKYTNLRVPQRKTVTMIHGNYSGCTDPLPDSSILQIVSVTQSSTSFRVETDYRRSGDAIDWSPAGAEPATGSTYSVTYDFLNTAVEPVQPDVNGFTVQNAVAGSSIMISYEQALPRIDKLCLNDAGGITWIKGVANEYNASVPQVPANLLAIASILHDWRKTSKVVNDAPRVVKFAEMLLLVERVEYCLAEVARNRLEMDAGTREAGAKVGMFVDPFLDDSMRDEGIKQTAAIVDGCLTLAIAASAHYVSSDVKRPTTAAMTLAVSIGQTLKTGSMQVNPYMSFAIPEGKAQISPSVDRWTEEETAWASGITRTFYSSENRTLNQTNDTWVSSGRAYGAILGSSSSSSLASELVRSSNTQVENLGTVNSKIKYLRQIDISFTLTGFGPGEYLDSINFGGYAVTPTGSRVADATGKITGTFRIPANVPSGIKQITFRGRASVAYGTFTGEGTLSVTTLRQVQNIYEHTINTTTVTTTRRISADPLAQTFSVEEPVMLAGVDLWFTARGTTNAQVQLRQVENGMPTAVVLAEAIVPPASQVLGGGHTRIQFDSAVPLLDSEEYAIVILCNDAKTALSIAEMGKFDANVQKWVTAQPYTVGVLLSSSNAKTWTAHQERDLTFRLLTARFAKTATEIDLGTITLPDGTTDIILMGLAELPKASCRNDFVVQLPGSAGTVVMAGDQGVNLGKAVSGAARVKARLYGDATSSPVLWPGTQIIAGRMAASGDYYTRSVVATGAQKATLIFDAWAPGGSTIVPQIQIDNGVWQAMPLAETVPQGDRVAEYRYEKALSGNTLIKVRLTLTGTPAARPEVYGLRLMAVK